MYLSRFTREDTEPLVTKDWSEKSWYPPKGQVGSPWLPSPDSNDDKLNMNKVEVLFILFCVQTGFAAFGMIMSFCDRSEQSDNKKKA